MTRALLICMAAVTTSVRGLFGDKNICITLLVEVKCE
jgi:hypothetical protein